MHAPPKMDGLASGHVDGWFDVKESYGKTKLAARLSFPSFLLSLLNLQNRRTRSRLNCA